MNTFSATELKQELATVLNSVQSKGSAMIKHRSRPDMILIEKEVLDNALRNNDDKAVLIADLTF